MLYLIYFVIIKRNPGDKVLLGNKTFFKYNLIILDFE